MTTEFEAKVLNIDSDAVAASIVRCGGKPLGQRLMRRYVYDIKAGDTSRWIRLRDTGSAITMAVKTIHSVDIDGTDEIEVAVGDFETANELLIRLGFTPKAYQESRRRSFLLEGVQLELDEWPRIPPYLEIEAQSREDVLRIAARLGFSRDQLTSENTIAIYRQYGYDLNAIPDLRFTAVAASRSAGTS